MRYSVVHAEPWECSAVRYSGVRVEQSTVTKYVLHDCVRIGTKGQRNLHPGLCGALGLRAGGGAAGIGRGRRRPLLGPGPENRNRRRGYVYVRACARTQQIQLFARVHTPANTPTYACTHALNKAQRQTKERNTLANNDTMKERCIALYLLYVTVMKDI